MLCRPVVDDQRLRHGEWQMNMDLVVSWVFSVLREMFRFYPVNKPVSQILELLLRIVTKRRFASSNVNWIRKSKDLDRCVPTHILQEFYYALADTACFNMYCNSNSMKELRATRNFLKEKKYKKNKIQGLSKRFEHLLLWPPRSPDLTPCDFFLCGYVKDNAYKPPLPKMCVNCKIAFELRCKPLMGTCWSASGRRDYRIDICRVTKGAHIEHLWADFGKLGHLHYLCVKLCLILTINT